MFFPQMFFKHRTSNNLDTAVMETSLYNTNRGLAKGNRWQLMKSVGGHTSLSLLFIQRSRSDAFMSESCKVMTPLILGVFC
jgi:hypothetical protein